MEVSIFLTVKPDFFGYSRTEKTLDATKLRKAIFGGYVSDYMKLLSADQPEKYKKQFSKYIEAGITPQKVEEMYKNAHKKIRATPLLAEHKKKIKKPVKEKPKKVVKAVKTDKDGKPIDTPMKEKPKKKVKTEKPKTEKPKTEKKDQPETSDKKETPQTPETPEKKEKSKKPRSYKKKRLSLNERRARVTQKLALKKKLEAAASLSKTFY